MKPGNIIIACLISALCYLGCDDTVSQEEIDKTVFPTSNVSYNNHVQKILNAKCATAGCHNPTDRADEVVLTSWQETMHSKPGIIVVPNSPETSLLINYVHESYIPPLTDNQRACITAWIKEGAQNN